MLWPAHAGGDADGALWACEVDDSGQLGLNDNENRHVFEQVGAGAFGARVVSAAARDVHSAALTEDGALWTWAAAGSGNWATMTGNAVWCQRRWRKRGSGAVRSVVPGAIIPREFLMFKQDCTLFIRSAKADGRPAVFFSCRVRREASAASAHVRPCGIRGRTGGIFFCTRWSSVRRLPRWTALVFSALSPGLVSAARGARPHPPGIMEISPVLKYTRQDLASLVYHPVRPLDVISEEINVRPEDIAKVCRSVCL